ncbi:MAG: DUF3891 family protein [Acidobacteriaceae bacterium]|nr:DUF3891 family protein [Acidobacteriaceae bacterium]
MSSHTATTGDRVMILRPLPVREGHPVQTGEDTRPAFEIFLETQENAHPPYAVVLQAQHSQLAGDLAHALRKEAFGGLVPEAIEAIRQHDFGWTESDMAQLQDVSRSAPRPFPALSAKETLPSWVACIRRAENVSRLVGVLISRHFCLLAGNDPERREFNYLETQRRQETESRLPFPAEALDRWTAALGFCDLLSLYLCSGATEDAEFPLSHPADPTSRQALKATLSWCGGELRLSPALLEPNARLSLIAREYQGSGRELGSRRFDWTIQTPQL